MIEIIEKFFAIRDKDLYPPCGMWSLGHIVALIVTLLLIGVAVYFSWKKSKEEIIRSTRVMAIVVTVLELIKIAYNFINGYTWLDAWFPLAYCSLLIYSLYMCGYGKGIIQKSGQVFLSGPAFIAGMAFLLFPSTSLADHPLFHYLSFYSMFFHALMVYFTIMFYKNKIIEYKLENAKYYILFMGMFSAVAIVMDYSIGCNMMFYNNPYNFPLQFVIDIYNFSNVLYTILIFIAYSSMYMVVLLFDKVFKKIRKEV